MNNQCGEFDQFTECPFFFNDLLIDATFFAVENEEYLIALSTESFQPPLLGDANI